MMQAILATSLLLVQDRILISAQAAESWVVTWKEGADLAKLRELCVEAEEPGGRFNGVCQHTFKHTIRGFSGTFSSLDIARVKKAYKREILSVEKERPMMTLLDGADSDRWEGSLLEEMEMNGTIGGRSLLDVQRPESWGLDLIDQPSLPLDSQYEFDQVGTGVNVYIIDSGIRKGHSEFRQYRGSGSSRVKHAFSAVGDASDSNDCHGHGTHVAATVGGVLFGVAKNVTLHAMKVMDCSGSSSGWTPLYQAMEWLYENAQLPAVAVMSLAGEFTDGINQAVNRLVTHAKIHVIAASGNSNKDACRASPAGADKVLTINAIDSQLHRYSSSNWGACTDLFAPGVQIVSAGNLHDQDRRTKSGTSMAAPHVAGAAALYLQHRQGASAEELKQELVRHAVKDSVLDDLQGQGTFNPGRNPSAQDISTTPNRLLHLPLQPRLKVEPAMVDADVLARSGKKQVEVRISLEKQPSQEVAVKVSVPDGWDGRPRAQLSLQELKFWPGDYSKPKSVWLTLGSQQDGSYYLTFSLESGHSAFGGLHYTLLVVSRKRSGDSADSPRIIHNLPFYVTGDTSAFSDTFHDMSNTARSRDVVYSITPTRPLHVKASTCGSSFDTKLFVFSDAGNVASWDVNDDAEGGCPSNTLNSEVYASMQVGTRYFVVVDGYDGAMGNYRLNVQEVDGVPISTAGLPDADKNADGIPDFDVDLYPEYTNSLPYSTAPGSGGFSVAV